MQPIIIGEIYTDSPPQYRNSNIAYCNISEYGQRTNELPTLLIGYHNTKREHPEMDILERNLNNNNWWTFSKSEYVSYYSSDMYDFIKLCYSKFIENINYFFVDIILTDDDKIRRIFNNFSTNNSDLTSMQEGERLYVYTNNTIFGFNLYQIDYLNKDKNKFINRIKSLSKKHIDSFDLIKESVTDFMEYYYNDIKYVPYIVFKSEIENQTI